MPAQEIAGAAKAYKVALVVLLFDRGISGKIAGQEIRSLRDALPAEVPLVVSGRAVNLLAKPIANAHTAADFSSVMARMRAVRRAGAEQAQRPESPLGRREGSSAAQASPLRELPAILRRRSTRAQSSGRPSRFPRSRNCDRTYARSALTRVLLQQSRMLASSSRNSGCR